MQVNELNFEGVSTFKFPYNFLFISLPQKSSLSLESAEEKKTEEKITKKIAKMAKAAELLLISAILFTTMLSFYAVSVSASGSHELNYFFPVNNNPTAECRGSIGECLTEDGDEEFQMDSESHRRILYWRRRYISYGALFRDRVPCSRRGRSYYNCRPGAPANPYHRGCSTITRCRS
ncbi:hypothetical protein M9H77_36750 [Catharanthus roseus]|uniref:Uncharacterized protein n=1 Tax=Catharanthus roseus TaxID=4058 RepID=A0ACB9ZTK8_CATRO|nr:hypothetical protein M9H77_36750 [Catharanthus roseus]